MYINRAGPRVPWERSRFPRAGVFSRVRMIVRPSALGGLFWCSSLHSKQTYFRQGCVGVTSISLRPFLNVHTTQNSVFIDNKLTYIVFVGRGNVKADDLDPNTKVEADIQALRSLTVRERCLAWVSTGYCTVEEAAEAAGVSVASLAPRSQSE
jgi:hypothetical protein